MIKYTQDYPSYASTYCREHAYAWWAPDMWKAYDCQKDEGYTHLTVDHSLNFVDPDTDAHTQRNENTWWWVKRSMSRTGTSKDLFESYLQEWLWRQHYGGDPFAKTLSSISPTDKKYARVRKYCSSIVPLYALFVMWSPRGILPCMGYIGMCGPKGYGFLAVLVINRVSNLADSGHK